jgi:hypothetical protein
MRIIVFITALLISTAHANLIDLTPGGFSENSPPPAFNQFLLGQTRGNLLFFDSISAIPYELYGQTYPPGWVSKFGILNGGVYFFSNLDKTGPVTNSTISWNFTGTDFWLRELYVWGRVNDSATLTNLYRVPWSDRFQSDGTVTLNGITNIEQIAFYGTDPSHVPDGGMSLSLFILSLLALGYLKYEAQRRRNA